MGFGLVNNIVRVIISVWLIVVIEQARFGDGSTLTPPYFNLAEGKNISASSTCGVGIEQGRELYCKLVGANTDNEANINLIQGQVCDYCDPNNPSKMHPPEFAVDGLETWWQSPPLSRGRNYNAVNLTIDLGQEFHVAYVYIRMGNSPRPGVWVLEKSSDYNKTYTPWQYFADTPQDCEMFFGSDSLKPITADNSVICTSEYSKVVPLEGGEIPISLLNNRPSAKTYFNSSVLQEWTRATNVRLRFIRTKNLLGHLMSVIREDPTVTRRYFYSIKDISIGGRCMCNGHADTCDIQDSENPTKLKCRCQHNTCGPQCTSCCSGYEQKAWRIAKSWEPPFVCEPCNCFQHSNQCVYDQEVDEKRLSIDIHGNYEGGGVCKNCQHNTDGINCHKCKPKFYRPYGKKLNDTDACQPCKCDVFYSTGNCDEGTGQCECRPEYKSPNCDSCSLGYFDYPKCRPCECNLNGTKGYYCETVEGQCPCKINFSGKYCKSCALDHYGFPKCLECECDIHGSISSHCDVDSGQCPCRQNFAEQKCAVCAQGYYGFPNCKSCDCNIDGTTSDVCDKENGKCICREGYGGEKCDKCDRTYFGYPNCVQCNCSLTGAISPFCDILGKCECFNNYAGRTCDSCSVGYYKYPECLECNCDVNGAIGVSCDDNGICQCAHNFFGDKCDQCREGFYNFPSCEECNCNPAGVIEQFGGCGSVPAGELCKCKDRVEGRICNKCKPLYWDLNFNNVEGCRDCNCHLGGVIGNIGVCNSDSGQCSCKPFVQSQKCTECVDATYRLNEDNLFGCSSCDCDVGGSLGQVCNKYTGQCSCHSRIQGLRCNEPLSVHYFPSLYHLKFEVEDGRTPSNTQVRSHFNESVFPGYSWKGYAVFSYPLQNEIVYNIHIPKSSLYRMIFRYVNPNPNTVEGFISIKSSDHVDEIEQKSKVYFKSTTEPSFITVFDHLGIVSAFVLNPGYWDVSVKIDQNFFLDYFVLIPAAYYEATILSKNIIAPCTLQHTHLCRYYGYANISSFDSVDAGLGFITIDNDKRKLDEFFIDEKRDLTLPRINEMQTEIHLDFKLSKIGSYVILLTYTSPNYTETDVETQKVVVESRSENSHHQNGMAILYTCSYIELCRQVVLDDQNRVKVFTFINNDVNVVLKGASRNLNVAISSISAIPFEDWSLNYITPSSNCVLKDGRCVLSPFRNPPDSKKIEFEKGNENRSVMLNELLYKNTSSLVYLNDKDPEVVVNAKVLNKGSYVIIVHYYQPDHPDFKIDAVIQNGKPYETKLDLEHCPSYSGCRSVLHQSDGNYRFNLESDSNIKFKNPKNHGVWLDYILIVPQEHHNEKYLKEHDFDQTGEFISTCGQNHFFIKDNEEGFCRDSSFSLTVDFNDGALPCNCDYLGSLSFKCNSFGGQCECKPNVIGRKCEICKSGYYGFPDCKPCNCPSSASCEPTTGACICPQRVNGDKCDRCMPLTYGFDPFNGCEECNCNYHGVANGHLQCDIYNGTCSCKDNIVGRTCDQCMPGHYAFPYCQKCDCDLKGTTENICDQTNAQCLCKTSVTGQRCDQCKEGTFNIQMDNEEGCSKCFCFGRTTRCTASNQFHAVHSDFEDWSIVAISESEQTELSIQEIAELRIEKVNEMSLGVDLSDKRAQGKIIYLAAPDSYLGNRLGSYGGHLNYTIFYTTEDSGKAILKPEVILYGADFYLLHNAMEQPASSTEFRTSLKLVESNFVFPNHLAVNREHIMLVLNNLSGLFIRITYWDPSITTRLSDITLTTITNKISSVLGPASSVEQCQCPPNYKGLSCEECAPGYYRAKTGPHGGFCVPCQCNNHADECDVDSGVCLNCQHNTMGDHCEMCTVGYHGNATKGEPSDCLICACPVPIESNNFATSCEVSGDGMLISCDCINGYYGARCQSCSAGYYGNPEEPNDYCKPCNCSGNINPEDPSSCDSVSGECLHCLNNTYGEACNLCAPGYYGDAIMAKDCRNCICDDKGTDHCDSYTGICDCRPNVVGDKCDYCAENHYGLHFGQGCYPCECMGASESETCDLATGQCHCKPGVTGRKCDTCISGYWNLTSEGCVSCGCKTEYSLGFGCNPVTGQCECLPGVIGEKCDQCPYRWVFVENQGCFKCDGCVHDLLDISDRIHSKIDPIMEEFTSTNSSYFTARKLMYLKDELSKLKPKVKSEMPDKLDLVSNLGVISGLEQDVHNALRKTNYSIEKFEKLPKQHDSIFNEVIQQYTDIKDTGVMVQNAIDDVEKLSNADLVESSKIDVSLAEAESILDEIKLYNFDSHLLAAADSLEKARELKNRMVESKKPVDERHTLLTDLNTNVKELERRIDDFQNLLPRIKNNSALADQLVGGRTLSDRLKSKINNYKTITDDTNNMLLETHLNLRNATDNLQKTLAVLEDLEDDQDALERILNVVNDSIVSNNEILNEINPKISDAVNHAHNLTEQSKNVENLFVDTRYSSENAVEAANAYKNIADNIDESKEAADNASAIAEQIKLKFNGIDERASESNRASRDLMFSANDYITKADQLKDILNDLKIDIIEAETTQNHTNEGIAKILKSIEGKSSDVNIEDILSNANKKAEDAEENSKHALNDLEPLIQEIPQNLVLALEIPKNVDEANKDISQIENQVNQYSSNVPELKQLIDQVEPEQKNLSTLLNDVDGRIKELNSKIEMARNLADRVDVGLKFRPSTTLELRNPSNLPDQGVSSRVSTYFKTPNPNNFLFYIGNEVGTNLKRTKSDDYMALEVENGYPVLRIDLGNGPEHIFGSKYVADNNWYQAIVERTGPNVKLIIREEGPEKEEVNHLTEKVLSGPNSILNLDENQSKVFVGGYPSKFSMQDDVKYSSFDGAVEGFMIGDQPVSLWNFVHGEDNNMGAVQRDKLKTLKRNTGYRFNGEGYAVLDSRPYSLKLRSNIKLDFKTVSPNGLIFLVGQSGGSFMSIELRDGSVVFQVFVNFSSTGGSGLYTLLPTTTKLNHWEHWGTHLELKPCFKLENTVTLVADERAYNDGQWHTIEIGRDGRIGNLHVDGEMIFQDSASGSQSVMEVSNEMYFGGYPGIHKYIEVTNIGFNGCIDNVQIISPVDLTNNIDTFGVTSGCPTEFAKLISFTDDNLGYLLSMNLSVNNNFQFNLKFKTWNPDGLLFYATNGDQSDGISLSLSSSDLVLISQKEKLSSSRIAFNDGEWHVVSVTHTDFNFRMVVDDYHYFTSDYNPPKLYFLYGELFIGGLPSVYHIDKHMVASAKNFVGCIGDVTLNGALINFANVTDRMNGLLGKCYLDKTVTEVYPEVKVVDSNSEKYTLKPEVSTTKVFTSKPVETVYVTDRTVPEIIVPQTTPKTTTIAATAKTTTTFKPSNDSCALPKQYSIAETVGSYRFGVRKNSLIEFETARGRHKNKYDFSLEFKSVDDGILFYVSDQHHTNYVALFIDKGKIFYMFNCGSGAATIMSDYDFSDGLWHKIEFSRHHTAGKLVIDGNYIKEGSSVGTAKSMVLIPPYYLGGVPLSISEIVSKNIGTSLPFFGCIKNFEMNGKPMETSQNLRDVLPCSDDVESGVYFDWPDGGFIKLKDRFRVGHSINIKLDIKPRNNSGLILSIYGRNDYLLLEMVDGVIKFTVDNGRGPVAAIFKPPKPFFFCDGQWHNIQAVKVKNFVTLSVDSVYSNSEIGRKQSTNTRGSMYLGGHPHINDLPGLSVRSPFTGCIRNVIIDDKGEKTLINQAYGDIFVGVCPMH